MGLTPPEEGNRESESEIMYPCEGVALIVPSTGLVTTVVNLNNLFKIIRLANTATVWGGVRFWEFEGG